MGRRIVIAPDKLKGSLTAQEAAAAIADGLRRADPGLDAVSCPVADGGEGTLAAALAAGFTRHEVVATGPHGSRVRTAYARRGPTAIVEMADVSGLQLTDDPLSPMTATSRGLGEVVAAALDAGCTRLIIGIGGSASTDGGAGLVQALGARLLDGDGLPVGPGGRALAAVREVDLDGLHPGLAGATITVASDVDNPLTGPLGAARVYGPQKGATPDQVRELDRALGHWADVVAERVGHDDRASPGAGAAGGVGFAALAVLGARCLSGVDLILDIVGIDQKLAGAHAVITGEGALDAQSLHGKAPAGVAARAARRGIPVFAIAGSTTLDPAQLGSLGIRAVYTLAELEPDLEVSMREAAGLLRTAAARLARDHLSAGADRAAPGASPV